MPPRQPTPDFVVCGDFEAKRGQPHPHAICAVGTEDSLRRDAEERTTNSSAVLNEQAASHLFELRDLEAELFTALERLRRKQLEQPPAWPQIE